ncbi:hypothetical protein VO63_34420 [Streptomyces showdoensis]|uniref:Uncharacterized protein n=1 Tax=Streptomyces showdoensis TaxID=68268 RepID=A0A2P2GEX6_STREW|nr:hypothetical protein VO63_34420 [Streptomyces showdoensis]
MPLHFDSRVIDAFRTRAGRPGSPFEGRVPLPLTPTGARSGTPHTTPPGSARAVPVAALHRERP